MEENLRQGFKYFNRFMLLLWRLGLGKWVNIWPSVGGQIMVVGHIGRKSGIRRFTPVNYAVADGELYCVAGFGAVSDWYRNIKANPHVEVWLPNGRFAGYAEDITNPSVRLPLLRQVLIGSGFAARAAGVDPIRMSDAELDALTASYQLVHIFRTTPLAGEGGPGDLAWVWPITAVLLLTLVLFRKHLSKKTS